jgi:Raf kinase inhibitor-like YbhB/YbcL family protein
MLARAVPARAVLARAVLVRVVLVRVVLVRVVLVRVVLAGAVAVGAMPALAGCGPSSTPAPPGPSAAAALTVTSSAFTDGGTIPADFTCTGAKQRPPLAWSGDLHGATTIAIVADDPDAPGGDFYHWIVVDVPPATSSVTADLPAGARQIKNSGGTADWTPPCPPSGTHHYRFTVYGLNATVGDVPMTEAFSAIGKAAVVQGRLTGSVAHR